VSLPLLVVGELVVIGEGEEEAEGGGRGG